MPFAVRGKPSHSGGHEFRVHVPPFADHHFAALGARVSRNVQVVAQIGKNDPDVGLIVGPQVIVEIL